MAAPIRASFVPVLLLLAVGAAGAPEQPVGETVPRP
jgi:hypothetical protein